MIRLSSAHTLQAVLAGAIATAQPRAVVSFSDKTTTAYIGNTSLTALNSTTPVTICAAPDVGTVRDIDHINVTNADTAAVTLTVRINTDFPVITITLQPGESVEYTHGSGWQLVSTNSITEADVVAIADAQIAAHVALVDPHAQYTLETRTDSVENGVRLLTLAAVVPGLITEHNITDPTYPYYANQNYTFQALRLNATTLRLTATGPIFFTSNIFNDASSIKTFIQQDIDLATISLPAGDSIYVLYVNINEQGNIEFTNVAVADSLLWVQLAVIAIKKVSGVISFLDDVPTPVKTLPNLAAIDNLARAMHHLEQNIPMLPNANLTLNKLAGVVKGECINWGDPDNVHELSVAAQDPCQFFRVSPANTTSLGTATTLIDPTQYWNGTALVTVTGGTNVSTIQRVLVTITGGILVQYGEATYASLDAAKSNLSYATFTDLLPPTAFVEIARIAMRNTATNLQDTAYVAFVLMGSGAGGGGAGGGNISDGDKGDISVTSAGTIWTIDNDVVTYAKMQNVSDTDKLLGRFTAGSGDVEEITCTAAGRALLDDVDAAAQRTTLGLGTISTQNANSVAISGGTINNAVIGGTTPAAGSFTTLSASGNTTLGDASTDTVTVNGYMGVGGSASASSGIYVPSTALSGLSQYGIDSRPTGTSVATASISAYQSIPKTAAASFTCADVIGFQAGNATKGAGSTITNQHGVYIADQTQGTNNYGITSAVSAGANKWNIYASGTAANYFAGVVHIGTTSTSPSGAAVRQVVSAAGGAYSLFWRSASAIGGAYLGTDGTNFILGSATGTLGAETYTERLRIDSAGNVGIGTSALRSNLSGTATPRFQVEGTTAETSFSLITQNITGASGGGLLGLAATRGGAVGSNTVVQSGDRLGSLLGYGADGTNLIPAAAVRFFCDGTPGTNDMPGRITFETTADGASTTTERMRIDSAGNVGIGTTAAAGVSLDVVGPIRSTNEAAAINNVTFGIVSRRSTNDSALYIGYRTTPDAWVIGASYASTGAFKPIVFATSDTERLRIDNAGNVLVTSAGGLGYGTGSGGAVTQATSRTTGVTLNKTNGAITLVSAAGSTAWQSFTVTNSTVAATDVIHVCQKSGTDLYEIHVTAVAAGSFRISFRTTAGTTTEQPVFNFAVIKGVTA